MSRPQVHVRRVTRADHDDFVGLWCAARSESTSTLDSSARLAGEGRVRAALAREDLRAYLAYSDGRAVGLMVLTHSSQLSFAVDPCVAIDQLYVAPEARRTGVARALLSTAATYADMVGAEQVATMVPAQARDTNRFFARIGFTPLVVKRVVGTTALHRRLAGGRANSLLADPVLMHRRRSLRARASRAAATAN